MGLPASAAPTGSEIGRAHLPAITVPGGSPGTGRDPARRLGYRVARGPVGSGPVQQRAAGTGLSLGGESWSLDSEHWTLGRQRALDTHLESPVVAGVRLDLGEPGIVKPQRLSAGTQARCGQETEARVAHISRGWSGEGSDGGTQPGGGQERDTTRTEPSTRQARGEPAYYDKH